MVRESIQIAAPKTTGIKMKEPRIGADLLQPHPELCEKVVTQLIRNGVILFQNFIQIALNATVEFS